MFRLWLGVIYMYVLFSYSHSITHCSHTYGGGIKALNNNNNVTSGMHIAKIFGAKFTKNSYPHVTNYVNLS